MECKIHLTRMTTRSTTILTRFFDNSDEHLNIRNDNNNILEELTMGLPNYTRKEIVTRWLKGEQRDRIALEWN